MKTKTKNRLVNVSVFTLASAPFWATAVLMLANIHDSVFSDRDGNLLGQFVRRDDCAKSNCFSFDKTGRIEESYFFGIGTTYSFNGSAAPKIKQYVAMPRMGMIVAQELTNPTPAQISHAKELHQAACSAIQKNQLQGYTALKCS